MKNKKLIIIGIVDEKNNDSTLVYIREMLLQSDYVVNYINSKGNINSLTNQFYNVFIINMKFEEISIFQSLGVEFTFLIHNFINYDEKNSDSIIKCFTQCEYFLLNSDDENWISLPLTSLKGILITFGFNSKATLTISSSNIEGKIKANLCLQREITSLEGNKIEPFEFSVSINSNSRHKIYSALAASIVNLIIDNTILHSNQTNTIIL